MWGVRGPALSHPRLPALWAGCQGPLPTGCGCGGVRAWGPVADPRARALSSWLCALWGRHEGARGGAPPAWVWGVRGRALSHPRLPALWAGCRGPLPTGCWCGGVRAWGPVTNPTARTLASWLCALWGRHEGSREGASCLGVGRPGSGALPPPTARPLGGLPGPTTHWLWVRGGAGVGTRHQPHSARSFELALRAVGAARGRPGGGRLLPWCGASGVGRSPTPDCPPSGRAAGGHYPLAVGVGGCGRGDPSQTPQRALLRAGFARCGGGMRVPGGAPSAWVWGVRGPALSHPRLPALWAGCRGPLPIGCGCGGVRAWGPVANPTARALSSWLCALWGRQRAPGGGRLLPGCGASGVGRSPTPDCPPSGRAARVHYPLAVGAGGCGRGDPSPTPQRALFRAGFARCGGGTRAPGGGRLLPGCGASGVGRSPTPDCPPSGRAAGVHYPLAVGAEGVRAWGPVTNPTARTLASWLCALWGRHEGARGGRLLPGCGASGVGRSPIPDSPPSGRAAGAHYPLAVGAGGRGRGDPSPTPQRALLRAGFARCGGGMRVPAGGASCLGVGRPGRGALPSPTARPLGRLPGCCACACPAWPGRAGWPPGRVLVRLTFPLAFLASLFACSAPSGLGLPCLWLLLGFFVLFFVAFPLLPLAAPPLCPALRVFRARVPWALASCPPPPPFFFFPSPPSVRPVVSCFAWFPAWGALGLGVLFPPPSFFLFFLPPPPVVSGVSCFPVAFGLCALPPLPLFFFFLVLLLFFLLRVRCVCSGVSCCVLPVLPVRCAVRVVCAVSGGWCCWFLVSLPFVGGLPVVPVARRCRLVVCVSSGARVWSGCRWASSLWCPVPLCCVLWRCAAMWCCAVVPCLLFFCFSPCWWHWFPVVPRWFWAPGRFRVVSVSVLCLCGAVLVCLRRCSLFGALLPSRDWLVFCVVACCVCVFAVGPGCPLLSPGCSWCRVSVACCGVSLGAVLRRVAARCAAWRCVVVRCVVSFCSVWCCRALCCVLGRCPSSWGPVPSGAVFFFSQRCVCFAVVCRCVVLFAVVLCAVCALGCRVVRFLSSPPCAVLLCGPLSLGALLPCAVPRGAVLPLGAVVSCPAALLGLFLAWVWLYLLEKPLQNFVKYFFPLFSWLLKIK